MHVYTFAASALCKVVMCVHLVGFGITHITIIVYSWHKRHRWGSLWNPRKLWKEPVQVQSDFRRVLYKTLVEILLCYVECYYFLRNCFRYFATHVVLRVIRAIRYQPTRNKMASGRARQNCRGSLQLWWRLCMNGEQFRVSGELFLAFKKVELFVLSSN